ncbi:kinase-like domain-containing protein [Mycena pura]|uniref:Kinase-like domain-containing protein n=1 Tax=Mycena pura TaxID=153505 RepID=A0AAD6VQR1_9AGAR|nr:kinase-like domain-containing protein [Mycena pura]
MISESSALSGTPQPQTRSALDDLQAAFRKLSFSGRTFRERTLREQFWVGSYEFLLSRGYQLRPRYHPGWVPGKHYEHSFISYNTNALDALCIKDNQKVVLKRVDEKELNIFRYLDALRSDARNHTIPLLDVIPYTGTEWTFVVMPYCRLFDSPPFHCRGEFVDAMKQYINGLQFMHEHNVVHFDIAPQNMVMEESRLIPKGSHWRNPESHSGSTGHFFSWKNRCSLHPAVRYYYIDFGLSKHFPGGKESARLTSTLRTFPMIPELSLTVPYNPFYVDIFQLGLAMSRIIDDYPALEDFRTVAASLTVDDPLARATLEDTLKELNCMCDQMSPSLLRKRIWEKGITRWRKVTRIVFGGEWVSYSTTI